MSKPEQMTDTEFDLALSQTRLAPTGASTAAARRVLVRGEKCAAAARELKITPSAVSRAVRRINKIARVIVCPNCGFRFPG